MSLSRSVIVRLPCVVERADVAGVQPAVGVDRLGGGLRVVEVAEHHVVAADAAARRSSRDPGLHARDRAAAGGRDRLGGVALAAHRDDDRLGHPERGHHVVDAPRLVAHPLDQHHGYDGRAGDREPQRGQVALGAAGRVEQRLVDRRRAGEAP